MSDVPRFTLSGWLNQVPSETPLPAPDLLADILGEANRRHPNSNMACSWADRRAGHDLYPEVNPRFAIAEITRWLRIVDRVKDPKREFALSEALKVTKIGRRLGDPWYERVALILVDRRLISPNSFSGRHFRS